MFRFKQFTIFQDRCAMKVTTDACIQGAWTPIGGSVRRVLDIGAGTGLLSLMLAQRSSQIFVDAVELDAGAAAQAQENISRSPWPDRVRVTHGDITTFAFPPKYDLIISNPPFYNNSLLSDNTAKNAARHTLTLSHAALLSAIEAYIAPGGHCSVMLPAPEYGNWLQLLQANGWHERQRLSVRHTSQALTNRIIGICSKQVAPTQFDELIIKNRDDSYWSVLQNYCSLFTFICSELQIPNHEKRQIVKSSNWPYLCICLCRRYLST